jgi:hypothetical protein
MAHYCVYNDSGRCRRDKYGFEMREEFAEEELRISQRNASAEHEKQLKWAEYLARRKKDGKPLASGKSFKQMVRAGIPAEYRRLVCISATATATAAVQQC